MITRRTIYPTAGFERIPDGFYRFTNRPKPKRARWEGDVVMIPQATTPHPDPRVQAEADRINALHRETISG